MAFLNALYMFLSHHTKILKCVVFDTPSDQGRLLDHERITKDEALVMMVDYLRAYLAEVEEKLVRTRQAYARF